MPDWDESSRTLVENLQRTLRGLREGAARRIVPEVSLAADWHRQMMQGLAAPDPLMIGRFRGEAGLEDCEVRIGRHAGVRASGVAAALRSFGEGLRARVGALDQEIAPGEIPTARQIAQVVDLCAWAHAEWVRIHPLANGNGRTARLWANFLAKRYGLPFFVRLRPRPDHDYAAAGEAAMRGVWQPTAATFRSMLTELLRRAQ